MVRFAMLCAVLLSGDLKSQQRVLFCMLVLDERVMVRVCCVCIWFVRCLLVVDQEGH